MNNAYNTGHQVILFDGVCNLCNSVVQFLIKRDKTDTFRFASLQSEAGQQILGQHQLPTQNFNSFVLYKNNKIYQKSTAALLVAKALPGWWPLLAAFIIIPPLLRDPLYDIIAQNRYKWFGKKESCPLPSAETRKKFFN